MNEVAWLPSLLVLGIGLAIGVAASIAVRRGRRPKPGKDVEKLRLRDLEARRDDLYRRLRSPDLEPGDRESLELAAAHTLRELDRLAPGRAPEPAAAAEKPPAAATAEAAPLPIGGRHPALVGFVAGMAVVLLVGTLVYLAVRDSGAAGTPAATAPAPDQPHPGAESLPTDVREEIARLEAAATAAPNDLLAFKRLALRRLEAGLLVEAFEDSKRILASRPEDPDGLFIQGVVRLSMGQPEEAVSALDRVLVNFPDHLQAMVYRGLALAQSGEMDQAISTWEMALDMAGGSHPDLEMLLQQAYSQQQSAAVQEAPAAPAAAAAPPPPPSPSAAAPGVEADAAYRVTVDMAAGRAVPPSGVLFVFLRPGESGPPVAVKRIAAPRFPLDVTLEADDAMMAGATLPDEGTLVVRLSVGGSVSARSPDDLEASSAAAIGQPTRLVLGGS